jgi:type II secretory pathway pseudopilin PulG
MTAMESEKNSLPQIVLDYIEQVIRNVKYRRKIRQEVKAELLAHFEDALRGVMDDADKQKKAEELIRDFGDAKLLATLIRRGKKRCRPMWQKALIHCFQAVCILCLLLILYIGWFFTGKPLVTTDYVAQLNQLVRPVADESQNAWPYYTQAAEKYIIPDDTEFNRSPRSLSTLTKEQRDILLKWISDNRESLDLIRQGNQKPHYWQIYDTKDNDNKELIMVFVPYLNEYRNLIYLLYWQALLDAERGDIQNAFDNTLESYSFGKHLRGQHTTLIEQLVAMGIKGISMETLRILLDEDIQNISLPLLDSTRKRFEAMIENEKFAVNFEGEKLFIYDEIQRGFTRSRIGISHLYINRIWQLDDIYKTVSVGSVNIKGSVSGSTSVISPGKEYIISPKVKRILHMLFTHPDQGQTLKATEQFYTEMTRLAGKTPATLRKEGVDIDKCKCGEEIAQKNILLKILIPALGSACQKSYRNQTDSYATLTIFAILQYYKTHKVYPDSIETLVQVGLLQTLPIDPYGNKPLIYRLDGDNFTLYSVGANFADDSGVMAKDSEGKPTLWSEKEGDAVFWPVQK